MMILYDNFDSLGQIIHSKFTYQFIRDIPTHSGNSCHFSCCNSCDHCNHIICNFHFPEHSLLVYLVTTFILHSKSLLYFCILI